jgi:hypothetical protein
MDRQAQQKSTEAFCLPGAFIYSQKGSLLTLSAFPSLMTRFGQ